MLSDDRKEGNQRYVPLFLATFRSLYSMSDRASSESGSGGFLRGLLPATWMGRAMSLGIAVWFLNWVFSQDGRIFGSAWLKAFVDFASLIALVPFAYFIILGTKWSFEHLLWRLRRRLLVTYFLLGVLPLLLVIVLVAAIGFVTITSSTLSVVGRQLDGYLEASRSTAVSLSREIAAWEVDRLSPAQQSERLIERLQVLAPVFPGVSLRIFNQSEPARRISIVTEQGQRNADEVALGFENGWPRWVVDTQQESHGLVSVRAASGTRHVYAHHLIRLPGAA